MEQRIEHKLALLAYHCLYCLAPPYLAKELQPVSTLDTRRRLRSATTNALVIPPIHLSTVGDRAFPVAAARVEQPDSLGYISSNAQHVQAVAENQTFHSLLWSAVFFLCMQTFCIILFYCCTTRFTFFLVKCPSSLWTQRHYNKSCLIITTTQNFGIHALTQH